MKKSIRHFSLDKSTVLCHNIRSSEQNFIPVLLLYTNTCLLSIDLRDFYNFPKEK